MRRAFHADVSAVDEERLSYETHPDDTVHVNSMLYALVKVLDKATALSRTAVEYRGGGGGGRGGGASRGDCKGREAFQRCRAWWSALW